MTTPTRRPRPRPLTPLATPTHPPTPTRPAHPRPRPPARPGHAHSPTTPTTDRAHSLVAAATPAEAPELQPEVMAPTPEQAHRPRRPVAPRLRPAALTGC